MAIFLVYRTGGSGHIGGIRNAFFLLSHCVFDIMYIFSVSRYVKSFIFISCILFSSSLTSTELVILHNLEWVRIISVFPAILFIAMYHLSTLLSFICCVYWSEWLFYYFVCRSIYVSILYSSLMAYGFTEWYVDLYMKVYTILNVWKKTLAMSLPQTGAGKW